MKDRKWQYILAGALILPIALILVFIITKPLDRWVFAFFLFPQMIGLMIFMLILGGLLGYLYYIVRKKF